MTAGVEVDVPLQLAVEQLDSMRKHGQEIGILDVREPWEVAICAIGGSVNVPLSTLPQNLNRLPKGQPLVVLCHHGMRSLQAVRWLRQNGFNHATNLQGGIDAWARQVDQSMATY